MLVKLTTFISNVCDLVSICSYCLLL